MSFRPREHGEWMLAERDEDRVDVHSFRALERLKVHEARTQADLGSGVIRKPDVEHRTERPQPAGQIVVVRRHDHGPATPLRPAHGLSALRLWQAAKRALSRLLVVRRRRRVEAAIRVALQARATRKRRA